MVPLVASHDGPLGLSVAALPVVGRLTLMGAVVVVGGWGVWRLVVAEQRLRVPPVIWRVALGLAVGIAAIAALVTVVGNGDVARVMGSLKGRYILLAALTEGLALACLAQVYRTTFALNDGRLTYREAAHISLGAYSLSQLLPGGGAAGAVFAARRLTRHGADPVTATATVITCGVVTMGTLGLLVSFGATVSALRTSEYAGFAILGVTVVVLLASALWAAHLASRSPVFRDRVARVAALLTRRDEATTALWRETLDRELARFPHPRSLARPAAWSAATWTLDITVLATLVYAAGGKAPLLALVLAYGAANLIAAIPVTPGGVGIVEAGVAGTLVAFGVDPAAASIAAIGHRLVGRWLPVALAAPFVLRGAGRARPTS